MNDDNHPESPESQFAQAIKDAGLELNGLPVMDGLLHRLPVASDKGSEKSGAYVGHLEGRKPGGYIQNFKTGEVVNWKAGGTAPELTPAERARFAIEASQRRKERDAAISAQHSATAAAAQALWKEAPLATAANAYCKAKGILYPGAAGLRVVPSSVSPECAAHDIKIVRTAKEAQEARKADPEARVFKAGDLLVPGRDIDGKMWTLQSINPYFKSLMKGGRKHGLFAVAGTNDPEKALNAVAQPEPNKVNVASAPLENAAMELIDAYNKAMPLLPSNLHELMVNIDAELIRINETNRKVIDATLVIAEGYATGDTVSRLLDQPAIVAFDSGNLDAVIRELRKQFPDRPILIAADNDHEAEINVGLVKANEAAIKYGCGVMASPFEPGDKGSDWNDLAAIKGDAVAKRIITDSMTGARLEADGNLATIKANKIIDAEKGMLATLKKTVATEFARHFKPRELNKQHVPTKNTSHERGGFEI